MLPLSLQLFWIHCRTFFVIFLEVERHLDRLGSKRSLTASWTEIAVAGEDVKP